MARQSVLGEMETNINTRTRQVEESIHEQNMRETRHQFDSKIEAIADKIIEFQQRGAEEYLIDMLKTFLDVALDMRDLMDVLEATSQGMQCIATAVGFVDEMLEFNMGMFETSLEHNYGFFERIKQKRRMKKAIRNNVGRMKMVVTNMNAQVTFATELVQEIKGVTAKLRKKNKKGKKGSPAEPDKADTFLANRLRERGEGGAAAGGAAATPMPPADGNTDSGIDDLI